MISAPNDDDWAYSQQLSALSGQACNFGEWAAISLLLPIPLSCWLILKWNIDVSVQIFPSPDCRFPDTYSIILSIKLLLEYSFSHLWVLSPPLNVLPSQLLIDVFENIYCCIFNHLRNLYSELIKKLSQNDHS